MMTQDVGVLMKIQTSVFLIAIAIFGYTSNAFAVNGCIATGFNGGCISCESVGGCSLTGPPQGSDFGNGLITFDGGVRQAQCTNGFCVPTDNLGGRACLGGGAVCLDCSTSGGCNVSSIAASALQGGLFNGLNLNTFLGGGQNLSGILDFSGFIGNGDISGLIGSLNQLSPEQLTGVLNQNIGLAGVLNQQLPGLGGNAAQQLSNTINGIGGSLNQTVQGSLGNILDITGGGAGGGGGGPVGGGSNPPGSNIPQEYDEKEEKRRLEGATANNIYGDENEIDPLKQYDDWPSRYKALGRSPIIFDPKGEDGERVYPELAESDAHEGAGGAGGAGGGAGGKKRPSFASLELGVDDEIRKSSWGIYQPLFEMQKKFAEDTDSRDEYLGRYETALGVAQTTLSFLDQTVASSLHQVQSQINADVTNSLLKQANWSLNQISNPQYAMLHADVDEKLQSCLAGKEKGWDDRIVFGERCKQAVKDGGCGAEFGSRAENSYAACQCCAETSVTVNKTVKDGEEEYSLVDRIFYGTEKPEGGGGGNGNRTQQAVEDVVKAFREMYGDIVIKAEGESLKYVYKLPTASIPQKIHQFRDGKGCSAQNSGESPYAGGGTLSCPITGSRVEHGICPSIIKMIGAYRDEQALGNNRDSYVVEASLGTVLNAANYEHMRMLAGVRYEELDESWEPSKTEGNELFVKWLNNFCDASAYAALNKLHTNIKSIVYDHVQLNQKATPEEKSQILRLVDRFSANFGLAETGIGKEQFLNDMLGGLAVMASRTELRDADNVNYLAGISQRPGTGRFGGTAVVTQR